MSNARTKRAPKKRRATPESTALGERLKALIVRAGLTQERFADMSGGALTRVEVSNATRGLARGKSVDLPLGVSEAVGVDMRSAYDYLRGTISLDDLWARRGGKALALAPVVGELTDAVGSGRFDAATIAGARSIAATLGDIRVDERSWRNLLVHLELEVAALRESAGDNDSRSRTLATGSARAAHLRGLPRHEE